MVVDGDYLFLFLFEHAMGGGGAIIRDIYVTFVYIGRWMVVDGDYLFLFLFEHAMGGGRL